MAPFNLKPPPQHFPKIIMAFHSGLDARPKILMAQWGEPVCLYVDGFWSLEFFGFLFLEVAQLGGCRDERVTPWVVAGPIRV